MRRAFLGLAAAAAFLSSCNPALSPQYEAASAQIDHVIVGVRDLDAGIATLERLTGVRPIVGGAHPGKGTRNALMSLGDGTYLELYAPDPAAPVASSDVAELQALTGLKPLGWAISTVDVEGIRSNLDAHGFALSSPEAGSRIRPDGSVLEWETLGFEHFDHALAPFFIRWKQPAQHPSRTSPSGCRLVGLHVQDPQPDRLAAAIRPLRLNVTVAKGRHQRMEISIACRKGKVTLR